MPRRWAAIAHGRAIGLLNPSLPVATQPCLSKALPDGTCFDAVGSFRPWKELQCYSTSNPNYRNIILRYKYRLVVDESLALGVLGRTGRGACEHFGLTGDDVEIVSASLGARGAHRVWVRVEAGLGARVRV